MPIPICRDQVEVATVRCCFCRAPTRSWTSLEDRPIEKQVACCIYCAAQARPEAVPSREAWIRMERATRANCFFLTSPVKQCIGCRP